VTTSQVPRWSAGAGRPRVLVECDDETVQDGVLRVLRESGYVVAACGGSETRKSRVCPLVTDGRCGLVDNADIVVHMLDSATTQNRLVLYAIRECVPETPIVVEIPPSTTGTYDDRVSECQRVPFPVTRQALIEGIEAATKSLTISTSRGTRRAPRTEPG
jgi:hypothetical protein